MKTYSLAAIAIVLPGLVSGRIHGPLHNDNNIKITNHQENHDENPTHRKLPRKDPCQVAGCPSSHWCSLSGKKATCIPYTCPPGNEWKYCNNPMSTHILIVGAGTAAMAAGRFLERFNIMNPTEAVTYRILEADESHLSGQHNMGRAVAAVDAAGAEGNPLYELKGIQDANGGGQDEWQVDWNDQHHFTCDGAYPNETHPDTLNCYSSDSSQVNGDRNNFEYIYDCVLDGDDASSSLGDELEQCYDDLFSITDWKTNGDKSRIWFEYDFEYIERPESIAQIEPEPAYTSSGQDKDIYLKNGAVGIIRKEYETNHIDRCVCAGASVTSIAFNGADITVKTSASGTFSTEQVILTPSVGVLAHRNSSVADPKGRDFGMDDKHIKAMERLFFSPRTNDRNATGKEHMPLYYTIPFQFDSARVNWDVNRAFINLNFTHPDSPFGMCRYWWVWNEKWGDLHDPGSNMIACTLTTEDIKEIESSIGIDYDIPEFDPSSATPSAALNKAITDLFRRSIAKAYGIEVPKDCYRCGLPHQPCESGNGNVRFDPSAASRVPDGECRYRVFPNKINPLWYGSYENVNPGDDITGDFADFISPILDPVGTLNNAIHVAGSASCENFWGFLQGAYYSGIRAATDSLVKLGKDKNMFPNDSKLDKNWCTGNPPFSIGNPRSKH